MAAGAPEAGQTAESIFVNKAFNPFANVQSGESGSSTTVSTTEFTLNAESDADKTKPVERLDAAFMVKLAQESVEAESDTDHRGGCQGYRRHICNARV